MNQLASRINRSPEAIDKVKLIAYYGYGYGNHTSIEWYMATQVAIWQVTDPDVYPTVARGNLTRTDRFDAKVNEIMNLVNNHTTHPSFDRQTVTMNVGDTITLRDTNGVLSNYYNSVQNENYTATISGNDLILTAKRAYTGTINLDTKENTNPPTFWDGANQICWSGSDPAYTKANIKLETKVKTLFYKKYGKQKDGVYRPEKDAAQIISRINGFTYVKTEFDFFTGKVNVVEEIKYSDGERGKVRCYGANDVREGVAIMHLEEVGVSITGNSTNPTRFQHPVAGTYKKECIEQGKKYFSVASGGGTRRTLHPDNMAAGPASYGMTDTMGRMHSDAQFAGSSSVPAHVEMMGLIGMGNNPMVGATVSVAVAIEETCK